MFRSLSVLPLLAVGFALAIAGCGSSRTSRTTGSTSTGALAYVHCMRSHGVPNLPDPGAEGGIELPTGIDASSPAFERAQTTCTKLMPSGSAGGREVPSEQAMAQFLALSTCMRAHGVSGFPDPTLGAPADPQLFAIAIGRDGLSLLVPKTIAVSSPAFKQAATTCRFGSLLPKGQRTPLPSQSRLLRDRGQLVTV